MGKKNSGILLLWWVCSNTLFWTCRGNNVCSTLILKLFFLRLTFLFHVREKSFCCKPCKRLRKIIFLWTCICFNSFDSNCTSNATIRQQYGNATSRSFVPWWSKGCGTQDIETQPQINRGIHSNPLTRSSTWQHAATSHRTGHCHHILCLAT